ncbi:MAG: outer membrane protein assembly factor BamB family protein [Candidatus Bathyarchaeia archaeon]
MNIKSSTNLKKTAIAIALIILMISLTLVMQSPVKAQDNNIQLSGETSAQNPRLQGSIPLPSGVTANITVNTLIFLSFSPQPVGVNQQLLVNIWFNPPTHYNRYLTGISVVITEPDGTTQTVDNIHTYGGDASAWFQYTPDQVGTYQFKAIFAGGYFPAGNIAGGYAEPAQRYLDSAYYLPCSTNEQKLTVQSAPVLSYPPSALPTDYWSRPVEPMNREWASILGNYPYTGTMTNPPADTNPYASNYHYTPYVQAPNSAHIVWMRQGAISGMLGGDNGDYVMASGGGSPSIIYQGRCYQTVTQASPTGTTSQSVWQCYDLQTGQIYWQIPLATGQSAPTAIHYDRSIGEVPGAEAATGVSVYFVSITSPTTTASGRIIYYSPLTGAVAFNVTGPSTGISAGTLYADPFVYSIQTINATANQYCLIKWTIERSTSTEEVNGVTFGSLVTDNFTARIVSNVTFPFSSLGTCDYQAGISATLSSSLYPNLGAFYGTRIMAADLNTGKLLFNITDPETCESSSELVVDHGKLACAMQGRHWNCYDGRTGQKLWTSDSTGYPWGDWWAYSVSSYSGKIIGSSYDGIYAIDWATGHISWQFESPASAYETPYVDANGTSVYPFFSGVSIADGKVFAYNTEHTPSQPLVRGWKLFAIDFTTGAGVWNITGSMSPGAVADGYLTASNSYDGYMYVFGKGQSATTVSVPQMQIATGAKAVISGTVLDQSPAQTGKACVSDASMTTYMEYLHMEMPIGGLYNNVTITGVPVSIDAIDPNGNSVHIGNTVSDVSGTYAFAWTPTMAGNWQITATFAGTNSYGSSWAESHAIVVDAQASTAPTTNTINLGQTTTDSLAMYIVAGVIAIIIAIAIIGVLLLKKK